MPALFDDSDLFAREAVKGIYKLVDLGFQGGNIGPRVVSFGSKDLVGVISIPIAETFFETAVHFSSLSASRPIRYLTS